MIKDLEKKVMEGKAIDDDILAVVTLLDEGEIRVAEKKEGKWIVNEFVKKSILRLFGILQVKEEVLGNTFGMNFRDMVPTKKDFKNVRIVPGGSSVRFGSFLNNGVVVMPPSYVNIGAFVDENTMIDSNVLVGSCAQIGKNVHLSAGVQIGGVLEPLNANPVVVENNAFIGAGSVIVEGVIVEENAVIGSGVVISSSTKILEIDADGNIKNEFIGKVPKNAVVVPGARKKGEIMLQTPVIIKYRDGKNENLKINDLLRNF